MSEKSSRGKERGSAPSYTPSPVSASERSIQDSKLDCQPHPARASKPIPHQSDVEGVKKYGDRENRVCVCRHCKYSEFRSWMLAFRKCRSTVTRIWRACRE